MDKKTFIETLKRFEELAHFQNKECGRIELYPHM